ncbi:hypothetical protein ACHAO1_011267 [Botrytis cinerea]
MSPLSAKDPNSFNISNHNSNLNIDAGNNSQHSQQIDKANLNTSHSIRSHRRYNNVIDENNLQGSWSSSIRNPRQRRYSILPTSFNPSAHTSNIYSAATRSSPDSQSSSDIEDEPGISLPSPTLPPLFGGKETIGKASSRAISTAESSHMSEQSPFRSPFVLPQSTSSDTADETVLEHATQSLASSIQNLSANVKKVCDGWSTCYQIYLNLPRSNLPNDTFELYILHIARFSPKVIRDAMYACHQLDFDSLKTECRNKVDKLVDRLELAGWWDLYFWLGKKTVHSRDAMRLIWGMAGNDENLTVESIHIALDAARKVRRKGPGVSDNPHVFTLTDVRKVVEQSKKAVEESCSANNKKKGHHQPTYELDLTSGLYNEDIAQRDSRFEQNELSNVRLGRGQYLGISEDTHSNEEIGNDTGIEDDMQTLDDLEMEEDIRTREDMGMREETPRRSIDGDVSSPELPRGSRKSLPNFDSDQSFQIPSFSPPLLSLDVDISTKNSTQLLKRKASQANIESDEEEFSNKIPQIRSVTRSGSLLDTSNGEDSLMGGSPVSDLEETRLSGTDLQINVSKSSTGCLSSNALGRSKPSLFQNDQSPTRTSQTKEVRSVLGNEERLPPSPHVQVNPYSNMMRHLDAMKQTYLAFRKDVQLRQNQIKHSISQNDSKLTEANDGIRDSEESCRLADIQLTEFNEEASKIKGQIQLFDKWMNDFPQPLMEYKESMRLDETSDKLQEDLEALEMRKEECETELLVYRENLQQFIKKREQLDQESVKLGEFFTLVSKEMADVRDKFKQLGTLVQDDDVLVGNG